MNVPSMRASFTRPVPGASAGSQNSAALPPSFADTIQPSAPRTGRDESLGAGQPDPIAVALRGHRGAGRVELALAFLPRERGDRATGRTPREEDASGSHSRAARTAPRPPARRRRRTARAADRRPTSSAIAATSAQPQPEAAVGLRYEDGEPARLGDLRPDRPVEARRGGAQCAHPLALIGAAEEVPRAVAEGVRSASPLTSDRFRAGERSISASPISSTSRSTSRVCSPSSGGGRRYSTGVSESLIGLATTGTVPAERMRHLGAASRDERSADPRTLGGSR